MSLKLDEPFHDPDMSPEPFELVSLKPPPLPTDLDSFEDEDLPYIVETPAGSEIVMPEFLDEETKVYASGELELLLAAACPHRHPTSPHMPAVRP